MSTPHYDDDALLPAVEAVFDTLVEAAPDAALPIEGSERFAFDVLLNSLQGFLETVRARDPGAFVTYRAAAIAALQDG